MTCVCPISLYGTQIGYFIATPDLYIAQLLLYIETVLTFQKTVAVMDFGHGPGGMTGIAADSAAGSLYISDAYLVIDK